jgi:hypothetical protein
MLKAVHIYPFLFKTNSLKLESSSLLLRSRAAQLYLASCANDSMPRQLVHGVTAQQLSDSAVITWISGGSRDPAIGTDFPRGNGKNHVTKSKIALLV